MFYVLDENKNLVEAFSKEEALSVFAQAIADGSLNGIVADAAFISKIKCCVNGITNNVAFVTTAKYNELEKAGMLKENTAYFITDDTTLDGLDTQIKSLTESLEEVKTNIAKFEQKRNLYTGAETLVSGNKVFTLTSTESFENRTFEICVGGHYLKVIPPYIADGNIYSGISGTQFTLYNYSNSYEHIFVHTCKVSDTSYALVVTLMASSDRTNAVNVTRVDEII